MTFRTRLLAIIVGLVVVTTAASLWVAQRQNSASYRAVVDTLLREQTGAFEREHELRHEIAAHDVSRLADSVRLFAALEASDPEVYKIAGDELRLGEFDFFRLLDGAGRLVAPPEDGRAGRFDAAAIEGTLVPANLDERGVQIGFAAVRRREGTFLPYRLLSAPIVNFDQRVGTLILGQRLRRVDQPGSDAAALRSALRIGDALAGGDLPPAVRAAIEAVGDTADAEIEIGGQRHRVQRFLLNPGSTYPPAFLVSAFSLDAFDARQRALALQIAAIGGVALLAAGLVGAGLAQQLARPVARLVTATRQIRQGRFEHTVPPASTTEMNTLAEAFNEMAAGLALKERYRSVLQQVADRDVADALVAGRIRLGGELRQVTVLFCDIRGYTPLTVGRRPEDVIELLNGHLGAMTRVVHAHGGVINQFAGDSIMALFGAPQSYGDDTTRAVACACAMVHERARLNVAAVPPIHVGVGIATGEMVAGCIGAEHRSDYTVVGERVNLAARLTAAASPGEIVVDDATRTRIGTGFATAPLPPLTLKGFAEPIVAHRVIPP